MSPSEQPAAQPSDEPSDPSAPQPSASQPSAGAPRPAPESRIEHVETPIGSITGTLHRAPRYTNFMILGAILGVVGALALTMVFPENADFSRVQIFGFLLLATLAAGVALGASVALLLDRLFGRTAKTVVADRVGVHESSAPSAPDAASDTRIINE
ncbi:MAG: hypothetical protein R6W83_09800 [Cryobacterium sp.]